MRLLLAALVVACFALDASVATAVRHGDLLITDFDNNRVLEVDPSTGAVTTFSPVAGGTNLLTLPLGIAADPDGGVYVAIEAGAQDPNLVAIDARGHQSFLGDGTVSNPWVHIDGAFGLAVSPAAAGHGARRELFVGGKGALWSVQQTTEAHAMGLTPYPAPHDGYSGEFLAARDAGAGSVDVAVGFSDAVLPYDGALFAFGDPWLSPSSGYVNGFAYSQDAGLYVLSQFTSVMRGGIYSLADLDPATGLEPIKVGGDVAEPAILAIPLPGEGQPAPYPIFVITLSGGFNLVRIDADGSISPVAALPLSDCCGGMAVYAPEPDSAALAATAFAALVWVRRRW